MGAVSSIVLGMALGALGWWLSVSSGRRDSSIVAMCFVAAACFLVYGAMAGLGRAVALMVIAASGLLAAGLQLLFGGSGRYRLLALAILAAGAMMAASVVFAVI